MTEAVLNVSLAGHANQVPGALKLSTQGVQWRPTSETSSGMTLAPDKVLHAQLTTLSGSATLSLVTAQKSHLWTGLKSSDVATVQRILSGYPSLPTLVESTQAVGGGNWGRVAVDAGRLSFLPPGDDDAKTTLQVNVTDATDVQLVGKHDLMMHFPVDGQDAEDLPMDHDALVEMSFYVPPGATAATMGVPPAPVEDEDAPPPHPGQALLERLREVADVDAVASGDAIATFEDVSMLIPRGKFDLEIFGSSLKLSGQNQDFSVRFSAMVRLFVLPKQGTPQTMVVISLDPPIRKGNTFYPHLVCQFPSVQESEISLEMTDADFAERQKAAGGRLEKAYQGPTYDVFSKVLRGLAATKLVRPGTFRTVDQEGWALRCSHKADDGFLYPLERAFFFLLKPPILIPFEDIRTVEFKRQAAGSGSKTFDLEIRRLDNSEVQFRGLNRNEWENLLQFLLAKRIPIENLAAAQEGPGGARAGEAEAFADLMGDGTESDDDDFQMDDGHEESTDEDASGGEASDDLSAEEKPKASKRAKRDPKDKTSPAAAKKKAKKEKKEKDPDAPKKPLSGFMIFSNEMRAKLKEEMPGMSVPEMGRKLGELWKGANAEERERFATLALEDKARYEAELVAYQQKALRDAPAQRAAGLELSDDGGDEVKVKAEE